MERFGICVASTDTEMDELAQSLRNLVAQWHLDTLPDGCQVRVLVELGQPSIGYRLGGGRGIRRLADMLAQVTQLSARRVWSGIDGSTIVIRFSRAFMPSSQLLERIAWALFLWTASGHVDHEIFKPLYGSVVTAPVSPNVRAASPVAMPVAHSTTVTQALPRPRHPGTSGLGLAATNPPPVKAKPKGG
ncbi:MAG: hypothetical protein C7B46_20680 [Sulfobacillus benefaciens]|uniref:Uncharacterized protein n=1 Tax=Sulfobacillus benefaciens TaxID=453960 RepID=A0A2T2WSV7_9FIRM|nr:MAG: hypothetical protein C7B46_20680 [Sulfobacillus benefaciens]